MAQMAGTSGAKPKPREERASIFPARQRSKVTKDLGRITENAVFLNKSGLYRQCAGAGKSGTRQTARAGALSIRPVVLKPRWFGMAIAFWRIDQNEAEMFRRAEPARSDCGAPGIPGEWLGTTALVA